MRDLGEGREERRVVQVMGEEMRRKKKKKKKKRDKEEKEMEVHTMTRYSYP